MLNIVSIRRENLFTNQPERMISLCYITKLWCGGGKLEIERMKDEIIELVILPAIMNYSIASRYNNY